MSDCAFCNPVTFVERIFAETEHFYCIASLGQITDGGYTLIFHKAHLPSMAAVPDELKDEFSGLACQTAIALECEYGVIAGGPPAHNVRAGPPIISFEHGIAGQTVKHAHMHLVPANVNLSLRMLSDFPDAIFEQCDILVNGIERKDDEGRTPYLLSVPPDEHFVANILWNPTNVPPQYFRTVLAEALGRPERANWREMDPELDKRLWSETVARLKKYF